MIRLGYLAWVRLGQFGLIWSFCWKKWVLDLRLKKNFESPPSLRSLASLTVPRRRQVQSSPSLLTHVVTLPRRPKSENSPYDWSVGGDAKVGCKQNLALGYRKSRIAISKVYRSFTAKKFLPRRVTTFPLGWPNTTYTLLLGWHLISNKFLLHQKNFCLSLRMKYRLYNFSENSLHYHLNFHFKKNILSSFKIQNYHDVNPVWNEIFPPLINGLDMNLILSLNRLSQQLIKQVQMSLVQSLKRDLQTHWQIHKSAEGGMHVHNSKCIFIVSQPFDIKAFIYLKRIS